MISNRKKELKKTRVIRSLFGFFALICLGIYGFFYGFVKESILFVWVFILSWIFFWIGLIYFSFINWKYNRIEFISLSTVPVFLYRIKSTLRGYYNIKSRIVFNFIFILRLIFITIIFIAVCLMVLLNFF